MADNLKWFKVWTHLINDPHFFELSLADMGRWTLLGAYIAQHGVKGRLRIPPQATRLCQILRCDRTALKGVLNVLPNVSFEEGTKDNDDSTVIMENWLKYQIDSTIYQRVKRLRDKRRGDKRREEEPKKKESTSVDPSSPKNDQPGDIDPQILEILKECPHLSLLTSTASEKFWDDFISAVQSYNLDASWVNQKLRKWNLWFHENPARRSRIAGKLRTRLWTWFERDLDEISKRRRN